MFRRSDDTSVPVDLVGPRERAFFFFFRRLADTPVGLTAVRERAIA
jgi:hypothetical protein